MISWRLGYAFALLTSTLAFAQNNEFKGANYNPIYLENFQELFDQASVMQSEAYESAKEEDREQMLENDYLHKKFARVTSSAYWVFGGLATSVATFFGGKTLMAKGYIPRFQMPDINPILLASSSLSTVLGGAIFFYSPIRSFTDWITNRVSSYATAVYQYLSGTTSDTLEKYEVQYVRQKPRLGAAFQASIEDAIFEARTEEPKRHSTFDAARLVPSLITETLALPTKSYDTHYERDEIGKLFHCYNEDTVKEIRRLIVRHVAGNQGDAGTQKYAVFFRGPPGTGKSRAAALVAKALKVPFQIVSLNDVTHEKFVGSRKQDYFGPGVLADALIKASEANKKTPGIENFVIAFEEADRTLNGEESSKLKGLPNYMLHFLNPSQTSYYNEFFRADISTGNMTTILLGNFDIRDEALVNRLHVIDFPPISSECKKEIVWNQFFPEIFSRYQKSRFKLNPEEFNDQDRENFDKDIDADQDPGMRSIYRKLEHYIADRIIDKIEGKLTGPCTNGTPPDGSCQSG